MWDFSASQSIIESFLKIVIKVIVNWNRKMIPTIKKYVDNLHLDFLAVQPKIAMNSNTQPNI